MPLQLVLFLGNLGELQSFMFTQVFSQVQHQVETREETRMLAEAFSNSAVVMPKRSVFVLQVQAVTGIHTAIFFVDSQAFAMSFDTDTEPIQEKALLISQYTRKKQ